MENRNQETPVLNQETPVLNQETPVLNQPTSIPKNRNPHFIVLFCISVSISLCALIAQFNDTELCFDSCGPVTTLANIIQEFACFLIIPAAIGLFFCFAPLLFIFKTTYKTPIRILLILITLIAAANTIILPVARIRVPIHEQDTAALKEFDSDTTYCLSEIEDWNGTIQKVKNNSSRYKGKDLEIYAQKPLIDINKINNSYLKDYYKKYNVDSYAYSQPDLDGCMEAIENGEDIGKYFNALKEYCEKWPNDNSRCYVYNKITE